MTKILLQVETISDRLGYGTPAEFTLHKGTFRVREIVDRWNGPDHAYFKLIAEDDNFYILRHDLKENEWELVLMETPGVRKGLQG